MQINISARHGHLSAATQEKISEKVEKLRRFWDRLTAIEVTVNLEHQDSPDVELRVSAEHTEDFVAAQSSSDVLSALDGALHKMEQQLRKFKDKLRDRRSAGHKHLEASIEGDIDAD